MFRTVRRLSVPLACLALLFGLGCRYEPAQPDAATDDEGYQAAVEEARGAYMAAETFDEKLAIARGFLERFPQAEDAASVVGMVAGAAVEAGRADAARELIDATLARLEDPETAFQVKMQLVDFHAKTGNKEALRALVAELGKERDLGYRDHYPIIEAALTAEDWELALAHSEASLAYATPAAYKEDSPDVSDAEAEKLGTRRVAYSLAFKGWAEYNLGRTEEAFASFREARESTDFSPLGVDSTSLHRYWGKALVAEGKATEAMDLLAAEALYGAGETALGAYREAYAACHDGEDGFEEHLWEERLARARKLPDFALPNYDGEIVSLADFAGDVVLLAFWFPT